MDPTTESPNTNLSEMKRNATYSLPWDVWHWLKAEALRRGIGASELITEYVRAEQSKSEQAVA